MKKDEYLSSPARIINGDGYIFSNGTWVSYKEYYRHNSLPKYEPEYKENPDSRSISPSVKVKSRK